MPATLTYPGVYIEEIPSGVRTITGVATSITAFIGRSLRGPTDADDESPVVINSYGDFERKFGGLWLGSSLGFAVRDFYLNGGSQAIIVRLFGPDTAELSAATAEAQTAADAEPKAAEEAVAAAADKQAVADAAKAAVAAAGAPGPAALAAADAVAKAAEDAVAAAADKQAVADAAKAAVSAAVKEAAAATAAEKAAAESAATIDLTTAGTNEAQTAADAVAKAANDAVAAAADKQAVATAAANAVAAAGAPGPAALAAATAVAKAAQDSVAGAADKQGVADAAKAAAAAAVAATTLKLVAANVGAWGGNLSATVDYKTKDTANTKLFNLTITETDPQTKTVINTEQFLNVSVDDNDPRYVPRALKQSSTLFRVKRNTTNAGWDVPDVPPAETTSPVKATGGSDGGPITEAQFTGKGKEGAKQGLFALEKADLFNLLCIPPYTSDGNVDTSLVAAAASYCELKRRAMLLVDPPSDWTTKDAAEGDGSTTGVAGVGTNSKNAALFFPRLTQPNPLRDKQMEDFVPCGAVAGIFARTDTNRGVWKAPAGLDATLVGVPKLSVSLTDAENGELNPLGVNCLRAMPAVGRVVWGSRTLQGNDRLASEWKYIAVRRTALYIEESLYRGTQWVVFEPNDEPLWAQIRLNVGAFMHGLFRQGAFQGQTPKDAYFVKCDKETTPQDQINLGIVNIVVGFAPLKPAEFVVIQIQQMAGQIET
jgi:phage tail sheath protein FI